MAKITTLQKIGIALLVLSPLIGITGAAASIYQSFSALEAAENAGIGSVGGLLANALVFTAGGLVGCFVGLVLFIVGRAKN
ncbi:MAG: hypothetical protein DMF63_00285 [Acidobacteria bacterium]|nr:MAG: hypothetical protein DMF63_00285 [Acidobacteriota bacterium]